VSCVGVGVVRRIEVVDVRRSRDALEVRSIRFIHSIGRGWRARESERGRSGEDAWVGKRRAVVCRSFDESVTPGDEGVVTVDETKDRIGRSNHS